MEKINLLGLKDKDGNDWVLTLDGYGTNWVEVKPLKPEVAEAPISSLQGVLLTRERRTGNTTRILDNAIQIILRGDTCYLQDHKDSHLHDHMALIQRQLYKRLKQEHGIESKYIEIMRYLCFSLKR